jgi:hypothetical protein
VDWSKEAAEKAFEAQKKRSEERTQKYVWKLLDLIAKLERANKSRRLEITWLREDLEECVTAGRLKFENGIKTDQETQ